MKVYDIVQAVSLKVINENSSFKEQSYDDKGIRKFLNEKELEEIFNPYSYLSHVAEIYKRVGIS